MRPCIRRKGVGSQNNNNKNILKYNNNYTYDDIIYLRTNITEYSYNLENKAFIFPLALFF